MVETARIPAYLEKSKIKTEISETADIGFDFGESSAKNGADAMKFTVKFSSGKSTAFSYSAEDELYYPGQYGVKMTDSLTGKQLSCTNVLVLKMSTKTLDSVGRVAITSTGSGEGMYFSGGKYIDITWSRSSTSEPFSFKTSDGSALTMLPGVTYVCTIPTNMDVTIS